MTTARNFISLSTAPAAGAIARVGGGLRHAGMPWGSRRIAPLPIDTQ